MFDWIKRKLASKPAPVQAAPVAPRNAVFTVTVAGPSGQGTNVQITEAEIAERARAHAFILKTDPPPLKTAEQWWEEAAIGTPTRWLCARPASPGTGTMSATACPVSVLPRLFLALEPHDLRHEATS